jgi:hypothetical protein
MQDIIVSLVPLGWLFSPARDAVKLTMKFGFIGPFVVDGH